MILLSSERVVWVGVESLDFGVILEPVLKSLTTLNSIRIALAVQCGPLVEAELVWVLSRDLDGVGEGREGDCSCDVLHVNGSASYFNY